MSYAEIIRKALQGRSVNQAAKDWHMQQVTLNNYVKGRLPDYATAKKMADEAGIGYGEMLEALAAEELKKRSLMEKISTSFNALLSGANPRGIRLFTR